MRRSSPPRRRPGTAVSLGAVVAVFIGVLVGAQAAFVSSDTASNAVGAGRVSIDWGATGQNELTIPITGLLPGQSTQKLADLTNTGTIAVSTMQLTSTPTPDRSYSDDIQMRIDSCSLPWTGSAGAYTCSGIATPISIDRPIAGRIALNSAASRAIGGTDHLRFTFRLPASSPATAQSTATSVQFRVLGNQVTGTQR